MKYTVADMPLTWRGMRVVAVASLGQISGTLLSTIVGVIIPLVQIVGHPELSPFVQGLIGAASLLGIMAGAFIFGPLNDRFGYKFFYRLCPALVLAGALASYFAANVWVLIPLLFFMGCGIGGEYSLDSAYISELLPAKWREFMTGVAKAASSIGNICAGLCWLLLLTMHQEASGWPLLMLLSAALAVLTLLCRIRAYESPAWLVAHGKPQEAQRVLNKIFGPDVEIQPIQEDASQKTGRKNDLTFRNIVFTGVPWACESFAVYGFAVFLPVLVMAMGLETAPAGEAAGSFGHVMASVRLTTYINIFVLVGFAIGLWCMRKMRYWLLQSVGFGACGVALLLMLWGYHDPSLKVLAIVGFMGFEMFLNAGPHLITFVLPTQIYPVSCRGTGSGIAAALGKVGSTLGVFAIPLLLHSSGVDAVLLVSAAVMALGALVTWGTKPRQKAL